VNQILNLREVQTLLVIVHGLLALFKTRARGIMGRTSRMDGRYRMKSRLIYNPRSGPRDLTSDIKAVSEYLASHGWSVDLFVENDAQRITELTKEAADARYDVVVASGGDGTISRVVNGLARTETALGVLPAGTGNAWASEMGIPVSKVFTRHALLEAADVLLRSEIRQVDLGTAGENYFLMWAGVGLDAKVTGEVNWELRRHIGNLATWIRGFQIASEYPGTPATISVDGKTVHKQFIFTVIGNAQSYAGAVRMTSIARMDDGLLDVCVFKGKGFSDTLKHLVNIFSQTHMESPDVEYYQGEKIRIEASEPLPVHLDGDLMCYTPTEFGVAPKALRVILPHHPPERLFITQ